MAWLLLILAGLLEVCWSLGLKYTNGFTNPIPSILTGIAIVLSMYLLAKSAVTIPIGTAYPIWVGIGALGAAVGGAILFKENLPPLKMLFVLLLLISIVGLKLTSR